MKILLKLASITALICCTNAFSAFEDQYVEVDEIVFADATGYISYNIPYMNGNELFKRIKFVTESGYEISVVSPAAGGRLLIYTPGDDLEILQLSSSSVRVRNMTTGDTEDVSEPSGGWPDLTSLALPSPNAVWELELDDLIDAYNAKDAVGKINVAHPVSKYESLGLTVQTSLPQCSTYACVTSVVAAGLHVGGTVAACGTTPVTGVTGTLCSLGWVTLYMTVGPAIENCSCIPVEEPPVTAIPVDDLPDNSCGPECSNYDTGDSETRWYCAETITGRGNAGGVWLDIVQCVRYEKWP